MQERRPHILRTRLFGVLMEAGCRAQEFRLDVGEILYSLQHLKFGLCFWMDCVALCPTSSL